ncbi:hypothetical protein BJX76DRAFT_358329 [Aspergillus varians]
MGTPRNPRKGYFEAQMTHYYVILDRGTEKYLHKSTLDIVHTKMLTLDIGNAGSSAGPTPELFFSPCPTEFLKSHPIDSKDQGTVRILGFVKGLPHLLANVPASDLLRRASLVCSRVNAVYSMCRRVEGAEGASLMKLSGWARAHHKGICCPDGEWKLECAFRRNDAEENPHSMIMLVSGFQGDSSRLLRGELLAIIQVMTLYLGNNIQEKNNIFPVMVFSFMGAQARILQAHFNDRGLSVYTSQLYGFSTSRKSEASIERLIQYMCSKPIGATFSNSPFNRSETWRREHVVPLPPLDVYERTANRMIKLHWEQAAEDTDVKS